MDQLIQITTVPIQYELKINNARLEYSRSRAELEIHKNDDAGNMDFFAGFVTNLGVRNKIDPVTGLWTLYG